MNIGTGESIKSVWNRIFNLIKIVSNLDITPISVSSDLFVRGKLCFTLKAIGTYLNTYSHKFFLNMNTIIFAFQELTRTYSDMNKEKKEGVLGLYTCLSENR